VVGDIAGARVEAVAALEARHGRAQPGLREVRQRGQDAAVDLTGPDVVAAAVVDLDALVGQHPPLELRLGEQQDLADRHAVDVIAVQHVLARGAIDRRGLEQFPAVEDRLGVDPGGALARGPDGEVDVRRLTRDGLADAAEHRPTYHA
jgi:hypothetical protein